MTTAAEKIAVQGSEEGLFIRLCRPQTLMGAWRTVRAKGARGGIDGLDPADLDRGIEKLLIETAARLAAREYVPAPYREIMIPKLNEAREWRTLALPAVVDKVVQQAVVDLIGPDLEKGFCDCSYAYRRGKGAIKACRRVEHILKHTRPAWVATCDIDDFFPSLSHDRLLSRLRAVVTDDDLVDLVGLWCKAGYIDGRGNFSDPAKGIAQGAVISPLLSNLFLDPLDRLAVGEKIAYVRYSDNYVLFGSSRDEILARRRRLEEFLERELGLCLNSAKEPCREISQGFDFLGIFFAGDGSRRISRAKEKKIVRRLHQLTDPGRADNPVTVRNRLNAKIEGHRRFYGYIEPAAAFARFDELLVRRLVPFLARTREKGKLNGRSEVEGWLREIRFYCDRSAAARRDFLRRIIDRVFAAPVDPAGSGNAAAGRSRRVRARQDRYVREVAGRSGVVVSTPGVAVGRSGRRLVLRKDRRVVCEVPFSQLSSITVISPGVSFSSNLVRDCTSLNIPVTFFDAVGRAYAVVVNPRFQSGGLTIRQVRLHVSGHGLDLGRRIVVAKCRSQMNLIKYYNRHRSRTDPVFHERVKKVLGEMEADLERLRRLDIEAGTPAARERTRNAVFTAEARIGAGYWEIVRLLLPAEAGFGKRIKRGARDLVNAMLNYGYGILYHRLWREIHEVRLNPEVAFLHAWHEGRPSLVYDLVEEYRQAFVDRPLFSCLTRGGAWRRLKLDPASGYLDRASRETVLKLVFDRFSGLVTYRGRKVAGEEIITRQVGEIADFIAGRRQSYRPYVMRY
jgi:group II intron reverse transcriptase/maturase/CRISPR-associated endonuclease Cas1